MIPFINRVNQVVLNPIISLLFGLASVYFIWSIIKLIQASKEGKDIKEEKASVFYGVVGMFIMVSVYGIINFILTSIDVSPPPYLENKLRKK